MTDIDEYFYSVLKAINPAWVGEGKIFHRLQQDNQQAGLVPKDDETIGSLEQLEMLIWKNYDNLEELRAKMVQLQAQIEMKAHPVYIDKAAMMKNESRTENS